MTIPSAAHPEGGCEGAFPEVTKLDVVGRTLCANDTAVIKALPSSEYAAKGKEVVSALPERLDLSGDRIAVPAERQSLSPKRYALGAAIAQAKRALAQGYSPAEAAALTGFFDQLHLTRHFKQSTGVTPAEYARAIGLPA